MQGGSWYNSFVPVNAYVKRTSAEKATIIFNEVKSLEKALLKNGGSVTRI